MRRLHQIHAYAIVSMDDRIADSRGEMPAALRNDADWAYFQAELDCAVLSLLGRKSHERAPNPRRRRRVVASRSVDSLTKKPDAWWWNPQQLALSEMLSALLPKGGRVAVPGGAGVFDLCRQYGFDAFHLSRKNGMRLRDGVPLFADIGAGFSAEDCFRADGLVAGETRIIDAGENVSLTVWRRP